jgi:hypothetical protein
MKTFSAAGISFILRGFAASRESSSSPSPPPEPAKENMR